MKNAEICGEKNAHIAQENKLNRFSKKETLC